jgi:23S rRNA pseudouridine2605 synthase
MAAKERLNKFLSRCGLASRRGADELIAAGRVSVDGRVVRELGISIDPARSKVAVDGKTVRPPAGFGYHAFNKPAGYLCSRGDPFGRPTIYDLLPEELRGLKYVGRLDQDTEGLLLLTDDGDLIERLTHPRHGLVRAYLARLSGEISDPELRPLRRGVSFEGEVYQPARVRLLEGGSGGGDALVSVEISEGRKREVKMMFRAIGRRVEWLRRVSFGPIELGGLPPGEVRQLTDNELSSLKLKSPA